MTELNPPWAIEARADHHSNVNRMMASVFTARAEGVAYGLAVSQRGAGANMSVDVAKGTCLVFGDENETQGLYGCTNDATVNLVIAAADPTNPRRDLIVAKVQDAYYSGATNAWSLAVVQGTAAASPADPTVPNNCLVLARVAVAAAAASITNANITDLRAFAPLPQMVGNSARRPGVLYGPFSQEAAFKPTVTAGQSFYEQDTGRLYIYDGTAWRYVAAGAQPLYAARLYRNAAQNIGGAISNLQIPYDTLSYDNNNNCTTGASAKYTAPVTGLYDVRAAQGVITNGNPDRYLLSIYVNGSELARGNDITYTGAAGFTPLNLVVADTIAISAGDQVSITLTHGTGGNTVALATGSIYSYCTIRKV